MLSDRSHSFPAAATSRLPSLVEQVFRRAERLTHGFLFRKRIKYNGDKKSVTRHWASWKKRYAVLSPGLLRLFPTENQTELDFGKCEEYSLQTASIRSHPYASTGYCIALYLRRNGSNLEITLAFPTELTRDTWFKAFETEAEILAAEAAQSRERALAAFRDFFNLRLRMMNEERGTQGEQEEDQLEQKSAEQLEEFSSNLADDYSIHYHRALHSLSDAVPLPDTPTESTGQSAGEPAFAESDEAVHTKQNGNNITVTPSAGAEPSHIADPGDLSDEAGGDVRSPHSDQDLQRIVGMSYLAVPLSRLRADSQATSDFDSLPQSGSSGSTAPSPGIPRRRVVSDAYKISIPSMSIVIMSVGTRGDLAPFVLLGRRLARDGHRVRIATHAVYREDVAKAGLEFYPLAGDPVKLSQFMVKSHGWVLPTTIEVLKEVPDNINMLHDIIYSCWPACTQPDPEDPQDKPFVADAIISNPVTYGHIHCAEALGIPLHLMFPQPWVPTKAFPHPLACLSYQAEWSSGNYMSYEVVERLMWLSVEPSINSFRTQLGLEPIRRGEHGWDILNSNKVPYACMFSSHLVSRPKDWDSHVDIVGNFFADDLGPEPGASASANAYSPPKELMEWLEAGPAPIFVGFGSMVIDDTKKLLRCLVEASAMSGARVLFQSGWTKVSQEEIRAIAEEVYAQLFASVAASKSAIPTLKGEPVSRPIYNPLLTRDTSEIVGSPGWHVDSVMVVGPCPHDWLFEHVAAVVHHGGAGTTAAGLRAGRPTLVCPFFGDQPFWGEMVFRAGVGPRPCPASDLTTPFLADSFCQLLSPDMKDAAESMAEKFKTENGVEAAVEAFYRHLPLESMVCDVSIFLGHSVLAEEYCAMCSFKMSKRVSDIVHKHQPDHVRFPCCLVSWGVKGPTEMLEGIVQGVGAATHEIVGGFADAIMGQFGSRGITDNVRALWNGLVLRPSVGGMYLMKKVYAGYLGQKHNLLPSQVAMRRRPPLADEKDILIDEKTIDDIIDAVQRPESPSGASSAASEAKSMSPTRAEQQGGGIHLVDATETQQGDDAEQKQEEKDGAKLGALELLRSPGSDLDAEYDFVHREGSEPTPRRASSVDKQRTLSTSSASSNVFQSLTERVRSTLGLGQSERPRAASMSQAVDKNSSSPGRLATENTDTVAGDPAPSSEATPVDSGALRDSVNEYQWLDIVSNLMQSFTEEETQLIMEAFETAKHCLQVLRTLNQNQSRYLTVEQIAALFRSEQGSDQSDESRDPSMQTVPRPTPERSSSAFRLFRQLLANTNVSALSPRPRRQHERETSPTSSEAAKGDKDSAEADEAVVVAKHVVAALAGSNSVVDFVNFAYFYMSVVDSSAGRSHDEVSVSS